MIACRCRRRWPALTRTGAVVLGCAALAPLVALVVFLPRGAGAQSPDAATVTPAPAYTATVEPSRAVVASRGGGREDWRALVAAYPWNTAEAERVVECESRGRADAWNAQGSGARGLFQTMGQWSGLAYELTGSSDLLDPAVNVAVAYHLWRTSGGSFWPHWAASYRCWAAR